VVFGMDEWKEGWTYENGKSNLKLIFLDEAK
jgi:hypothetical protein